MKSIFISFATHDLPLAQFLCRCLNAVFKGRARFFLSDMIEPGADWLLTIKKELDRADAGLLLLTPFSIARPWVFIEFGAFWSHGRKVFPVIAGLLGLDQVPRPLNDFQIADLDREDSVLKLLKQIAAICGCPIPRSFDPKRFCSRIRKMLRTPCNPTDEWPISIHDLKKLPPQTLIAQFIQVEPPDMNWRVLEQHTLSVSGKLEDAGFVVHPFPCASPLVAIVLEVENSDGINSSFAGRMVKLVVNNHPILPIKSQQHPGDSQYVRQQDGFFCYPLKKFPLGNHFELKLVFYKIEFKNLLFRVLLVPKSG
jgi:hypothetical protein